MYYPSITPFPEEELEAAGKLCRPPVDTNSEVVAIRSLSAVLQSIRMLVGSGYTEAEHGAAGIGDPRSRAEAEEDREEVPSKQYREQGEGHDYADDERCSIYRSLD